MPRYFLKQLLTFKLWSNFLTPESIHGFRLTDRQQTAKLQNIESGIRPIRKYRIRSYTQFSYFLGALKISFCMSQNHVVVYAQSRLGRPPLHYVAQNTNYPEVRPLVCPGQLGHFMYGMGLWLFNIYAAFTFPWKYISRIAHSQRNKHQGKCYSS